MLQNRAEAAERETKQYYDKDHHYRGYGRCVSAHSHPVLHALLLQDQAALAITHLLPGFLRGIRLDSLDEWYVLIVRVLVYQDIFEVCRREQLGHSLREHGFTGAWGAHQKDVSPLPGRFLYYLRGALLPDHLVDELLGNLYFCSGIELLH